MKKMQSNKPEGRTITLNSKKAPDDNSSKSKNPPTEPEKTQGIEDAQVMEKTPSEKMEEILKNNDKFETIKVLMELICKELGLPISADLDSIVRGLHRVTENYYKSMEEWKKMTKKPENIDIRQ